mmetsp:Transcript_23569/g.50269  ORF Transcript_23569/g.50269 Transcript_23569/m.50269 type:complete len:446 (-) Transcript_23569:56-1393(-)
MDTAWPDLGDGEKARRSDAPCQTDTPREASTCSCPSRATRLRTYDFVIGAMLGALLVCYIVRKPASSLDRGPPGVGDLLHREDPMAVLQQHAAHQVQLGKRQPATKPQPKVQLGKHQSATKPGPKVAAEMHQPASLQGQEAEKRQSTSLQGEEGSCPAFRVGFVGSSFIHKNDVVHLVQALLTQVIKNGTVGVRACTRGTADLGEVFRKGCRKADEVFYLSGNDADVTVSRMFSNTKCSFDAIVLQDNFQRAAVDFARNRTEFFLANRYAPLLGRFASSRESLIVLMQTWAPDIFNRTLAKYLLPRDCALDDDCARERIDEGLSDFRTYTKELDEGYERYRSILAGKGFNTTIAHAGNAVARLREKNPSVWKSISHQDRLHLRPAGVFLVANVIAKTIVNNPKFAHLFTGTEFKVTWPPSARLANRDKKPSSKELSSVLLAASPL